MKTLKYIFALLLMISFISCSSDDDSNDTIDFMQGLNKIYEFDEVNHQIEIYSDKNKMEVGYNDLYLRVKDVSENRYLSNVEISWMPMMHMENMQHSAPHSQLSNMEESSIYKGYIVFQMAENQEEYWDLSLEYKYKGEARTKTYRIAVTESGNDLKKVHAFEAEDGERYVLAYVGPKQPKVAINDFEAVLYRMENMMSFPVVENYTITVDPRMPGMGNHGSPNNEDLLYDGISGLYKGKLSLTMTGYWKINLKMLNQSGDVLKGEDVNEGNPTSSLYFEIEF